MNELPKGVRYTIIQRSMWSAFTLDILNAHGMPVGCIRMPTFFQYKNGLIRIHKEGSRAGNIKLDFEDQAFDIAVEVLRRASAPDLRFTLEQESIILAAVDIMGQPGLQTSKVLVRVPFQGEFHNTGNFYKKRYELRYDSEVLACVFEPRLITLRLRLEVQIISDLTVLPVIFAAYVLKELLY